MSHLIDKIRAALDEDERIALETIPGLWRVSKNGLNVMADDPDIVVMENVDQPGPWHRALPHHIAHHDPVRALREVAASREILERHKPENGTSQLPSRYVRCSYCWDIDREGSHGEYGQGREWPCPDVVTLAKGLGIEVGQ